MIAPIAFIIAVIIADQAVKYWAVNSLSLVDTIPVIKDVFHLTYAENRGAAFSMLSGKRWFFIFITVAAIVFIIYLLKKKTFDSKVFRIGSYMVIGGAIGNLIDRTVHGFVVDLFDFCLINFPVFNIADIFLTCGGALWIIHLLFIDKDFGKKKEDPDGRG